MVQQVKLVLVQAAWMPSQFPTNAPEKAEEGSARSLGPATHVGDSMELLVPAFRLCLVLAVVTICGVNQQMDDIFVSPTLLLYHLNKCILK